MTRRKEELFNLYIKNLSDRLLQEGILSRRGPQSLSVDTVRRIEEVERVMFFEDNPDVAEDEYPESDAFGLYLFISEQEPLPSDPEDFVRAYFRACEKYSIQEFIREDADSEAQEAYQFSNRGNSRFQLGRVQEALDDFDQAVSLAPEEPFFYGARAHALVRTGNLEKALEDLERAIELSGEGKWPMAEYLLLKANVLFRFHDYAGVEVLLKRTLRELSWMANAELDDEGDFQLTDDVSISEGFVVKIYQRVRDAAHRLGDAGRSADAILQPLSGIRRVLEEKDIDLS